MKELATKLEHICSEIFKATKATVKISVTKNPVWAGYLFHVESDTEFTFWEHQMNPISWEEDGEHEYLRVVPGDHPCFDLDEESDKIIMINGACEAYITGNEISSVYAPSAASKNANRIGHTWGHMNHNYKAQGCDFKFSCGPDFDIKALSKEIFHLVTAALGKSLVYKYVSVSGGFYSAKYFDMTYNQGHTLPGTCRGSEYKNMEKIDFLKNAGTLGNAFIPEWFTNEGWLEFYEKHSAA